LFLKSLSFGLSVRAYFTSQATVKLLGTIERCAEPLSSGLFLIQVENKTFEEIYANNKTVGKKLRY